MSTVSIAEVARKGQSVKDSLSRLFIQQSMKNPSFLEQIMQIETEQEADPNAFHITGNKTLDAFAEYLLRQTLATAEDDDDDPVIFTPSSSVASAVGNDAQGSQSASENEKETQKETTASLMGMLAKLLVIKTAPSTQGVTADEPMPTNNPKPEVMKPMEEIDSDKTITKPSQRSASVLFDPDFKTDLAKTIAVYFFLDLVVLTPGAVTLRGRFLTALLIFLVARLRTFKKLGKSTKNTAAKDALLEKAKYVVSCWALIALLAAVKVAIGLDLSETTQ